MDKRKKTVIILILAAVIVLASLVTGWFYGVRTARPGSAGNPEAPVTENPEPEPAAETEGGSGENNAESTEPQEEPATEEKEKIMDDLEHTYLSM